jgi:hypothetical protein
MLKDDMFECLQMIIYMIIFGSVFSIPVMLVLIIIILLLQEQKINPVTIKIIVGIAAVLGVNITFVLVLGAINFSLPIIYSLVIAASVWGFKFPDYLSEKEP